MVFNFYIYNIYKMYKKKYLKYKKKYLELKQINRLVNDLPNDQQDGGAV